MTIKWDEKDVVNAVNEALGNSVGKKPVLRNLLSSMGKLFGGKQPAPMQQQSAGEVMSPDFMNMMNKGQ